MAGDADTIRKMVKECYFTGKAIVYAFEHNKTEELYLEAKRQVEIIELYHDLCLEDAKYYRPKSIKSK